MKPSDMKDQDNRPPKNELKGNLGKIANYYSQRDQKTSIHKITGCLGNWSIIKNLWTFKMGYTF